MFPYIFLGIFLLFFFIKFVFLSSSFIYSDEIKFPQQIIIDKKLSMKLYVGNMQLL